MKRDQEVGLSVYLKKINPAMKEVSLGLDQREEREDLIEVNQDLDLEIEGGEGVGLDH
jgi:hypothetical protein